MSGTLFKNANVRLNIPSKECIAGHQQKDEKIARFMEYLKLERKLLEVIMNGNLVIVLC